MNTFQKILRLAFGTSWLIFGLNKFAGFMEPPALEGAGGAFMGALSSSYMWYVLGGVMMICGIAIMLHRFVALALLALAPIMANIILFHAYLDFSPNMAIPAALLILHVYFFFVYKASYAKMLMSCSGGCGCDVKKK